MSSNKSPTVVSHSWNMSHQQRYFNGSCKTLAPQKERNNIKTIIQSSLISRVQPMLPCFAWYSHHCYYNLPPAMYAVYIYISQSVYVTAYMNPSTEVCVNIFRLDSQKNGFPIECHWGTKKTPGTNPTSILSMPNLSHYISLEPL